MAVLKPVWNTLAALPHYSFPKIEITLSSFKSKSKFNVEILTFKYSSQSNTWKLSYWNERAGWCAAFVGLFRFTVAVLTILPKLRFSLLLFLLVLLLLFTLLLLFDLLLDDGDDDDDDEDDDAGYSFWCCESCL